MLSVKKLAPLAAFAMAFTATPALADAITFDSSDVGTTYTLNYNGFADGNTVQGLTAQTSFTLTGISGNTYSFDYAVANTSGAPITGSRISSFAFDTNPDIASASSTGAFGYTTVGGTYPNGIGTVDVCFKDAATGSCAGGGSGGLTIGESGSGTFNLTFAQPVSAVTLSDFFVRYQSISGAGNVTSASGAGTQTSTSTSSGGTTVPEPGMLGLLGGALIATALLRRRRRREDSGLVPAFA
jgi:PEP-CTERM motif